MAAYLPGLAHLYYHLRRYSTIGDGLQDTGSN